jgi:hypothetical protein
MKKDILPEVFGAIRITAIGANHIKYPKSPPGWFAKYHRMPEIKTLATITDFF